MFHLDHQNEELADGVIVLNVLAKVVAKALFDTNIISNDSFCPLNIRFSSLELLK
jgi:hypothetical protein